MPIYVVNITWLYSTETLTVDTTALPRPGDKIFTSANWSGKPDPHQYNANVVGLTESEKSITLTLRYVEAENVRVDNDSWGTSEIVIDFSKEKPSGNAKWTDDRKSHYSGAAPAVHVTKRLTPAEELAADLAGIERTAPETEREAQILARVGQGKFRADVIREWKLGEVCAVTGINVPELLIASHILPWCESDHHQRLDPANGLLLAAHVDKLFDRHLLSFRQSGAEFVVEFSPRIRQVADCLRVNADTRLAVENLDNAAQRRFAEFMQRHFERFTSKLEE